jgi:hypothetical protein
MYQKIVSIFILFTTLSCSSRIGDFTALSTRNANIKNWKRSSERVEGKSCEFWVLIFPIGDRNIKDAVEDGIDKYNNKINGRETSISNFFTSLFSKKEDKVANPNEYVFESFLDVKFSHYWWTILLLSRTCLLAEGTPADSWYSTIEREDQIKK